MSWNLSDIGDLSGQVIVVTGANSGVGYHASRAFVANGAHVVMACRNQQKAADALAEVRAAGSGTAEVMPLDLADLDSVASFAAALAVKFDAIDALVNNAGVMGGARETTAQGLEMQMGTNHLGHFALTAQVWPLLLAAPAGRVVSLSSLASRTGQLTDNMPEQLLSDPQPYSSMQVYSNTKQATLLFSQELHRRAAGSGVKSLAAHPGVAATNLFGRALAGIHLGALTPVANFTGRIVLHSPKASAESEIRAVTDPTLQSGDFLGPGILGQFRGAPVVVSLFSAGADPATAARLWTLSERITGIPFTP